MYTFTSYKMEFKMEFQFQTMAHIQKERERQASTCSKLQDKKTRRNIDDPQTFKYCMQTNDRHGLGYRLGRAGPDRAACAFVFLFAPSSKIW